MQGGEEARSEAYFAVRCNDERRSQRRRWAFFNSLLRLNYGDIQADLGQDVSGPNALLLAPHPGNGLSGVVDLPGNLPSFGFRAANRFHELAHDFLKGVAVAVVKDGHPGGADDGLRLVNDFGEGATDTHDTISLLFPEFFFI